MKRTALMLTLCSLSAASLLSGCGGGSSSTETPAASTPTSCEQPYTWLDRVRMSGNRIGTGAQGEWVMSCNIRTLQTASLTVCVTHADTTELQLALARPDNVDLALPALAGWTSTGNCPSGQPWTYAIPLTDLPLTDFSGRWVIRITDKYPNNTSDGIFNGWSFSLKGLR